jgi:hypothetical protein
MVPIRPAYEAFLYYFKQSIKGDDAVDLVLMLCRFIGSPED